MGAGRPADNVYKSTEAGPLGDLLARINQAPGGGGGGGGGKRLSTPPQDFLTRGKE